MSSVSKINKGGEKHAPWTEARTLSIDEFLELLMLTLQYTVKKSITKVETIRDTLMHAFRAGYSLEYFTKKRDDLLALDDTRFRHAIIRHCCGERWQDRTLELIHAARQDDVDEQSFEALHSRIVTLNDLLEDTPHFLTNDALKSRIHTSLSDGFRRYILSKKISMALPFGEWIDTITSLDSDYATFEKPKADELAAVKAQLASTAAKRAYYANSHYNNDQTQKRQKPDTSGPVAATYTPQYPAKAFPDGSFPVPSMRDVMQMQPPQARLYSTLEICNKCRDAFAGHFAKDCPSTRAPKLTVPFRPLNDNDVENARKAHQRSGGRPIPMNAILSYKASKPVAATTSAITPVDDISSFLDTDPIAALFGDQSFTHFAAGPFVYEKSTSHVLGSSFVSNTSTSGASASAVAAIIEASDTDEDDDDWSGILGSTPPVAATNQNSNPDET